MKSMRGKGAGGRLSVGVACIGGWMLPAFGLSATAGEDVYTQVYRSAVERHLAEEPARRFSAATAIKRACYAWMLGERTGEDRYRAYALAQYDRFLPEAVDHDFHRSRPFGILTLGLHRAGALTGERRAGALQQARARVNWFLDQRSMPEAFFDCNIALADTLAVACLARVFAGEPDVRSTEIRHAVAALGERILRTGDLNENAANYSSLGICFFLELAYLEGWWDRLRASNSFRTLVVRQREILSPSGILPEFGDSYFRWRDRPLDFACLLEVGARLYEEPTFSDMARRIIPTGDVEVGEDALFRGLLLLTLDPYASAAEPDWPDPSMVLYRRVPDAPDKPVADKLILRTGREPGDAMVMMDLYADGSHAHNQKRPSIAYFEAAGVPLFHNMGRRGTKSALFGNSFWIWPAPARFPGFPREGSWNTASLPASWCRTTEVDGEYTVGEDLLFRNNGAPGLEQFWLDNLRLEGPRGILLLDGFEAPDSWAESVRTQPGLDLVSSPDRTQGRFSQQSNWTVFGSKVCVRRFEEDEARDLTFRLSDYDTIKLDYKYMGQHPRCNLRNLVRPGRWTHLGDRVLPCVVEEANARQVGRDGYGVVRFSDYAGAGNRLTRQMVLTAEGALVVVDRFMPGPESAGWAGGPLWHLYALAERGDDWFVSESDGVYRRPDGTESERRMLVKFMRKPGADIDGVRVRPTVMHALRADGSRHDHIFTTFAKAPILPATPLVSAFVVLPLAPGEPARQRAEMIRFDSQPDGTVWVHCPAGGRILALSNRDGGLDIRR